MSGTLDGDGLGMSSGLFSEDAAIREDQNDSSPSSWSGGADQVCGLSTSYSPSSTEHGWVANDYFSPVAAEVTGVNEWPDSTANEQPDTAVEDAYFPTDQAGATTNLSDGYFPADPPMQETQNTSCLSEMYFPAEQAQSKVDVSAAYFPGAAAETTERHVSPATNEVPTDTTVHDQQEFPTRPELAANIRPEMVSDIGGTSIVTRVANARPDYASAASDEVQQLAEAQESLDPATPQRDVEQTIGGPTEGGSELRTSLNDDGTLHETAFHREARVHFSQDRDPDGTASNRHWTDHDTGAKVGG